MLGNAIVRAQAWLISALVNALIDIVVTMAMT
jgi:hypothetical protein